MSRKRWKTDIKGGTPSYWQMNNLVRTKALIHTKAITRGLSTTTRCYYHENTSHIYALPQNTKTKAGTFCSLSIDPKSTH